MADSNPNMIADAMKPFGLSLLSYFEGAHDAVLMIRRDDGFESAVPVKHFFRTELELGAIERSAMELCLGHVLDIGSGTGTHSIILKSRGFKVTAVDITSEAVAIMNRRGIQDCLQGDIFEYRGGLFDTLIMLGHGLGIVGDLIGLSRFLKHARSLVQPDGQLLFDSVDVSRSKEPADLAYHRKNREAGRYMGEINMQFEFQGHVGPFCKWLHIDQATLKEYAGAAGWNCEIILENENGEYLARLMMIRTLIQKN